MGDLSSFTFWRVRPPKDRITELAQERIGLAVVVPHCSVGYVCLSVRPSVYRSVRTGSSLGVGWRSPILSRQRDRPGYIVYMHTWYVHTHTHTSCPTMHIYVLCTYPAHAKALPDAPLGKAIVITYYYYYYSTHRQWLQWLIQFFPLRRPIHASKYCVVSVCNSWRFDGSAFM